MEKDRIVISNDAGLWLDYKYNPIKFISEVLGVTDIYDWQKEALLLYANYGCKLAIRSGHGVGKTAFLSWLAIHHLLTHFPSKVPCTAPSSHQLFDLLWAEISKWTRAIPTPIKSLLDIKSDRIELMGYERECFIVARTARKETPEAFQGFHGDNLLFIVDESSGVDDIIFEVAEGALTSPGAKIVETGNPTRASGHFADVFKKDSSYRRITVSSENVPGVSKKWLSEMENKYGRDSNRYRFRVLGLPPTSDTDSFIDGELVELATNKKISPQIYCPIWGLDPARFGHCKSALAKRQGNLLSENIKFWNNKDSKELAQLVIEEYVITDDNYKPSEICVDVIGIGSGVYDRLCEFVKDMGLSVLITPVNTGTSSLMDEHLHLNYKVDLWTQCRDWFVKRNTSVPDQVDFKEQLCSVGYKYTTNGKLRMQSKEELMNEGIDSPDLADAFVLTFAGTEEVNEDLRYNKEYGHVKMPDIWEMRRKLREKKSRNVSWMAN